MLCSCDLDACLSSTLQLPHSHCCCHHPLSSRPLLTSDVEAATSDKSPTQKNLRHGMWAVMTEAFTLTFLAEWGDRSQIATIALAAAKDPVGGASGPLSHVGTLASMSTVRAMVCGLSFLFAASL